MEKATRKNTVLIFLLLLCGTILAILFGYYYINRYWSTGAPIHSNSQSERYKGNLFRFVAGRLPTSSENFDNKGNAINNSALLPASAVVVGLNISKNDSHFQKKKFYRAKGKADIGSNTGGLSYHPIKESARIENKIPRSLQNRVKMYCFTSFVQERNDTLKPVSASLKAPDNYNTAIILRGTPQYQQEGLGNVIIQGEDKISYNMRWVNQVGWYNYTEQMVSNSLHSNLTTSANGTNNIAKQYLVGLGNAKVSIAQTGSYNYANQKVHSYSRIDSLVNAENIIEQSGEYNYIDSYQLDKNNHVNTTQSGKYNKIKVSQRAQGDSATISQHGSNNTVQISQN